MFKRILVGLDGSEKAKNAARVACDLAKHYSGTVTLVHVPHAETAAYLFGESAEYHAAITLPSFAQVEAAGQRVLDEGLKIASDAGCKRVETCMPHGDASTELLVIADEINADLIVTGRRGLSRVASFVLGSTSQRISHLAKCACMSVL